MYRKILAIILLLASTQACAVATQQTGPKCYTDTECEQLYGI